VAEPVVDLLEVVEMEQQHRHRPWKVADCSLEVEVEGGVIEKTCERVTLCLVSQAGVQLSVPNRRRGLTRDDFDKRDVPCAPRLAAGSVTDLDQAD